MWFCSPKPSIFTERKQLFVLSVVFWLCLDNMETDYCFIYKQHYYVSCKAIRTISASVPNEKSVVVLAFFFRHKTVSRSSGLQAGPMFADICVGPPPEDRDCGPTQHPRPRICASLATSMIEVLLFCHLQLPPACHTVSSTSICVTSLLPNSYRTRVNVVTYVRVKRCVWMVSVVVVVVVKSVLTVDLPTSSSQLSTEIWEDV